MRAAEEDRSRVAVTDLDLHIAHRGVERAGSRVAWRGRTTTPRIHGWWCRRRTGWSRAQAIAGKEDHVPFPRLVVLARRVLAKHEYRPRRAKSKHSTSSPNLHRRRQPV